MQVLKNVAGAALISLALFGFYHSVKDGFQKTFGPFDDVKVQYKWMDSKLGHLKCVAKAPGEDATPCNQKSTKELNEYKLLWEMPEKTLAQVAYARKE